MRPEQIHTGSNNTKEPTPMEPFRSSPSVVFFFFFFFRTLVKRLNNQIRTFHRKPNTTQQQRRLQRYTSLLHRYSNTQEEETHHTLVFDLEGALLRSSSLFSYFMVVAFEAGSAFRAILLLVMYPVICLVSEEMGLKMMVMVSFCGIKEGGFSAGRAVLPKFFLEDVGLEGFEVVRRFKRKVGVSKLPEVMVESFLREYLEIDCVHGRKLRVWRGYFVGLMEEGSTDKDNGDNCFEGGAIGVCGFNNNIDHLLFSQCKEMYMVKESLKRKWHGLPKPMYPKPLIFHDGRLATTPTLATTLVIMIWAPFGVTLAIFRSLIALTLPHRASIPILAFSGLHCTTHSIPSSSLQVNNETLATTTTTTTKKGLLYVCNHRTLLDPLYVSFCLLKPVTAVTYSLSRLSELLSPIRTVRLTRDREQDACTMDELLDQGDVVVCPEGTTCREPYLLRFSPLFSEISDSIVPVALESEVSMFHGTTAGGFKAFDPLFFLMNPRPGYTVRFFPEISGSSRWKDVGESRFRVANQVQREIGEVLGFQCTGLTRKDKYTVLAGNDGVVSTHKKYDKINN